MHTEADLQLLKLIRLKATLSRFPREPETETLALELDARLDQWVTDLMFRHSAESPDELMAAVAAFAPPDLCEQMAEYRNRRQAAGVRRDRERAIAAGERYLRVSVGDTALRVPVHLFSWEDHREELREAFEKIRLGQEAYDPLCDRFARLFASTGFLTLLHESLDPFAGWIPSLVDRNWCTSLQTVSLLESLHGINELLTGDADRLKADVYSGRMQPEVFAKTGAPGRALLWGSFQANPWPEGVDPDPFIACWEGPDKAALMEAWLGCGCTHAKKLVATACTGIHPEAATAAWNQWVIREKQTQELAFHRFCENLKAYRFEYGVGFVMGCRHRLEEALDPIWRPVIEAGLARNRSLVKATGFHSETGASEAFEETAELAMEAIPETEDLEAPEQDIHPEDRLVEDRSTWNRYLKPFLSENLLGVMGGGLLLLAWICLSFWIWKKGTYYRLFSGVIPMLMTSLFLGWIAHFFHKHAGAGERTRAPFLFSVLSVISIPFNFWILLCMLFSGSRFAVTAGVIGIGVQGWAIFRIDQWVCPVLGFASGAYLMIVSLYMLVPAFVYLIDPALIGYSPDVVMYAIGLTLLVKLLKGLSAEGAARRERFRVLGGHALVVLLLCLLYLRMLPSAAGMAIFLSLAAFSVNPLKISENQGIRLILASVFSVSGLVLAFFLSTIALLPCYLLLLCLWMVLRRQIHAAWPEDILAGLLIVLGPFTGWVFDLSWEIWALLGAASLVSAILFEWRLGKYESRLISIILPFAMILLAGIGWMVFRQPLGWQVGAGIGVFGIGLYGYCRYVMRYRPVLWQVNLLLMALLAGLWCGRAAGSNGFFAAMAAGAGVWSLVSGHLKDPMAYQYRTVCLWCLCGCAGIAFSFSEGNASVLGSLLLGGALCVAARGSGSQIPVYGLLALAGAWGIKLQAYLEWSTLNGFRLAGTALLLFFAGRLLRQYRFWQVPVIRERFWGRDFPLQSSMYAVWPFEIAAWGVAAVSLFLILVGRFLVYAPFGWKGTPVTLGLALAILILLIQFGQVKKVRMPATMMKAFLFALLGEAICRDRLIGWFAGLFFMGGFEYLFMRWISLCKVGPGAEVFGLSAWASDDLPFVFLGFLLWCLGAHLTAALKTGIPEVSFLVYALFLFAWGIHRRLDKSFTGYLAICLFVYANGCLLFRGLDLLAASLLSRGQALAAVLTLSILVLHGVDFRESRWWRRMNR